MALFSGPFRRHPSDLGLDHKALLQSSQAQVQARLATGLAACGLLVGLGAPMARADTGVTITSYGHSAMLVQGGGT
ncbi:MAG: hypothetical protein HQ469_09460, partial [Cyanobacteria bacterium]|nr:hypothetical protein [Cyanobacteria bacterium bin.275]